MSGPWALPLVRLKRGSLSLVTALTFTALLAVPARPRELKPETVAAFDLYARATEARIARDLQNGHFLLIDGLARTGSLRSLRPAPPGPNLHPAPPR